MRIALIRHPAPLIEPGICYGRLDIGVAPGAEAQIDEIAANPDLYGATCVWSSPSRRCRGLAGAIAQALGMPLTIDPRLQELDFGAWEGRSWDAIARADLDRWSASPLTFAPPGGESGAALIARISAFHAGLRQARQDCAIVSHGGPLKVLAALLSGHSVDLLAAAPPLGSIRIVTCPPF
jgi:alpha-ribazole phosphatase